MPRGESLAEVLALGEAGDDVEAERAGADEAADDDHREDDDDALVGGEQAWPVGTSAAGPSRAAGASSRPADVAASTTVGEHGPDAVVDQPDDRRRRRRSTAATIAVKRLGAEQGERPG